MSRIKKIISLFKYPALLKPLIVHHVAAGTENIGALQQMRVSPVQTIIDIGANRGQFALVARKIFPSARIISFEPQSRPAKVFRKLFARDPLTRLYELAIGPDEKPCVMHTSKKDDSSSLLPIGSLQRRLFKGTDEIGTQTVSSAPLITVVKPDQIVRPAILKLDVQGYEQQALIGCKALLDRLAYIYVECSFVELYTGQSLAGDVISWLSGKNFALIGVYNLFYDRHGKAIQADFLFQKRSPDSAVSTASIKI